MILLDPVGAGTPGVYVEGAVVLLGPGVVVLERQVMPVGKPPVDLHESRAGVVGPRDRPEVPAQRASERRVHPPREGVESRARRPRLLLDLVVHLLIVGDEEECLVALQGTAEREAELVLAEVRRERLRAVCEVG